MKVITITNNKIEVPSTAVDINMYYGRAKKDFEFNGVKYTAGDLLTSKSAFVTALINPVDLELGAYTIGLTDSKGNTNYKISNVANNMSKEPLSRAADKEPTANKGVFDLSIAVADGVAYSDLEGSNEYAYALSTKDAFGKEILSDYAIKVKASSAAQTCDPFSVEAMYRTKHNLDELVGDKMNNAVDFYYAIEGANRGTAELMGVEFDAAARTIYADKEGDLVVTVHYLKNDGSEATADMTISFKNIVLNFTVADMAWTITPDAKKQWVASDVTNMKDLFRQGHYNIALDTKEGIAYTSGKIRVNGKDFEYEDGSVTFELVATDIDGEKIPFVSEATYKDGIKFYVVAKFDPENVAATSHNVKLNIIDKNDADKVVYSADFKVVVKQDNDAIFKFEPLDAYFDKATKTEATVFGKLNGSADHILYNLNKLFKVVSAEDASHITFEETIPEFDGKKADAWLTGNEDEISVAPMKDEKPEPDGVADKDNAGVYSTRKFVSTYLPFGNERLATYSYEYNLTVKSPIKEGKHDNVTKIGADLNTLSMTNKSFDFTIGSNVEWKEASGAKIIWSSETRVSKYQVALSEVASGYMTISVADGETDHEGTGSIDVASYDKKITIKLKDDKMADIQNDIAGTDSYVIITVIDKWGARTQSKVLVPIKARAK